MKFVLLILQQVDAFSQTSCFGIPLIKPPNIFVDFHIFLRWKTFISRAISDLRPLFRQLHCHHLLLVKAYCSCKFQIYNMSESHNLQRGLLPPLKLHKKCRETSSARGRNMTFSFAIFLQLLTFK